MRFSFSFFVCDSSGFLGTDSGVGVPNNKMVWLERKGSARALERTRGEERVKKSDEKTVVDRRQRRGDRARKHSNENADGHRHRQATQTFSLLQPSPAPTSAQSLSWPGFATCLRFLPHRLILSAFLPMPAPLLLAGAIPRHSRGPAPAPAALTAAGDKMGMGEERRMLLTRPRRATALPIWG